MNNILKIEWIKNLDCSQKSQVYIFKIADSKNLNIQILNVVDLLVDTCDLDENNDILVYTLATTQNIKTKRAVSFSLFIIFSNFD